MNEFFVLVKMESSKKQKYMVQNRISRRLNVRHDENLQIKVKLSKIAPDSFVSPTETKRRRSVINSQHRKYIGIIEECQLATWTRKQIRHTDMNYQDLS
jgi:hypothetical protein